MVDKADEASLVGEQTVVISAGESGERLDKALARILPQLSRARVQRLIAENQVRSPTGILADSSRKVASGEQITINLPEPRPADPEPEEIPLKVVFEDDHLIVIDKPAGMTVHPAPGQYSGTLVNALLHHCAGSLSGIGGVARPGIVHRIDKDTSGLLVVAKTDAAHAGLARQFEDHSIERVYQAIVWGVPKAPKGTVHGNIGRSPTNRKKMAILPTGGKHAVTHWRTIEIFEQIGALIECRLETGRTHQIRVHMSHIAHPLIGDPAYGGGRSLKRGLAPEIRASVAGFDRQALHAAVLGFNHPITGKTVHFTCELPQDMAVLLEALRQA